jgi:hypothetical protein
MRQFKHIIIYKRKEIHYPYFEILKSSPPNLEHFHHKNSISHFFKHFFTSLIILLINFRFYILNEGVV